MKSLMTTLLVTLTLVGCSSSAQLVRKDTVGGRVALQGAFMPAMSEARVLMAEHCHGRFEAVERAQSVEFRCRDAAATGDAQVALATQGARGL